MNLKLIQYIQKNLNSGYDANTVRKALTNHGFPANEVDNAINDATSQAQQSKGGCTNG